MADARPAPWRAPRRRRGSFIADSRRRTAPVEPPMLASVVVAVLAWPRCVATFLCLRWNDEGYNVRYSWPGAGAGRGLVWGRPRCRIATHTPPAPPCHRQLSLGSNDIILGPSLSIGRSALQLVHHCWLAPRHLCLRTPQPPPLGPEERLPGVKSVSSNMWR